MVRQLSIDQFENEGKRVIYGTSENATVVSKLLDRQSINSVPRKLTEPLDQTNWQVLWFRSLAYLCSFLICIYSIFVSLMLHSVERISAASDSVKRKHTHIRLWLICPVDNSCST